MVEAERTAANDEEMLRRAYAAAYHWQRAARTGPENEARATYMLAKAHLLAGHPDMSLLYADRAMEQCRLHGLADFDLAYAYEARARALQALGHTQQAATEWAAAKAVPIADPDDQAILDGDLKVGP
jgi:tetratricopeptide (TPR) repeat protein